jgi:hypothetical protein
LKFFYFILSFFCLASYSSLHFSNVRSVVRKWEKKLKILSR